MSTTPPTRLLLVRHGQSVWNAEGRWQGHADVPLSDLGREQARLAASGVGAVDVLVASDLVRAIETAELLGSELGVGPVAVHPGLRERGAGEWTGLSRAEIEAAWPGYLASDRRPPAFEPVDSFAARVLDAVRVLVAAHAGLDVLAVTHGGVLRAIERALGGPEGGFPNLTGLVVHGHPDGRLELAGRPDLLEGQHVVRTRPAST